MFELFYLNFKSLLSIKSKRTLHPTSDQEEQKKRRLSLVQQKINKAAAIVYTSILLGGSPAKPAVLLEV